MYNSGSFNSTTEIGRFGEDEACKFLRSKGWKIVERNWRFSHYEIDIIAKNEEYLIFVEVKTREHYQNSLYGTAAQAVNYKKQLNIIKAAQVYLARYPTDLQARLDIIEVYTYHEKYTVQVKSINHYENAYMRR